MKIDSGEKNDCTRLMSLRTERQLERLSKLDKRVGANIKGNQRNSMRKNPIIPLLKQQERMYVYIYIYTYNIVIRMSNGDL